VQHAEAVLGDRLAQYGEIEVPFGEDGACRVLLRGGEDHQHAFLAFGQHHFVGSHAGLALGHAVKLQLHAQPALVAHFHRRAGQPRRAHVLYGDHSARGH